MFEVLGTPEILLRGSQNSLDQAFNTSGMSQSSDSRECWADARPLCPRDRVDGRGKIGLSLTCAQMCAQTSKPRSLGTCEIVESTGVLDVWYVAVIESNDGRIGVVALAPRRTMVFCSI